MSATDSFDEYAEDFPTDGSYYSLDQHFEKVDLSQPPPNVNSLQANTAEVDPFPEKRFSFTDAKSSPVHSQSGSEYEYDNDFEGGDNYNGSPNLASRSVHRDSPTQFAISAIAEDDESGSEKIPTQRSRLKSSSNKSKKHDGTSETVKVSKKSKRNQRPLAAVAVHNPETDSIINASDMKQVKSKQVRMLKPTDSLPTTVRMAIGNPVTSQIASGLKHDAFLLERQLDAAIKKINTYSREKAELQSKLDSSNIETEFQRFQSLLIHQDNQIKRLISENKALANVNRGLSKVVTEQERSKDYDDNTDSAFTAEGQVKILLERIRRLNTQLAEVRAKEKAQLGECEKSNRRCNRMKLYIAKLSMELDDRSRRLAEENKDEGQQETKMAVHRAEMSTQTDDSFHETHNRISKLNEIISKQNKNLKMSKESFSNEFSGLKSQLIKAIQDEKRHDTEIEASRKECRSQALTIDQLKHTCEKLQDTNRKLQLEINELQQAAKTSEAHKPVQVPLPPQTIRPSGLRKAVSEKQRTQPKGGILFEEDSITSAANGIFITSDNY